MCAYCLSIVTQCFRYRHDPEERSADYTWGILRCMTGSSMCCELCSLIDAKLTKADRNNSLQWKHAEGVKSTPYTSSSDLRLVLAGESNLKIRRPVNLRQDTPSNAQEAVNLNAVLTCERPNPDLHTFLGKLAFHPSTGMPSPCWRLRPHCKLTYKIACHR